ncbi:hypothetical protein H632_c1591p0, partial [Helicosporidium sp. ATCC 50920]
MATAGAPINVREVVNLPNLGIQSGSITFTNVTLESDKYLCVRETTPTNQLTILDLSNPSAPQRRPITAESAIMNPDSQIIALKATVAGQSGDSLQIFNLGTKTKLKSVQFPQQVVFWKWVTAGRLGLVTAQSVYHWDLEGASEPVKAFDRTANLEGTQIISYRCSPDAKWCVLVGIAPGAPERPALVRGVMQLYSVEASRSQSLDAHAAGFGQLAVAGRADAMTVIAFAQKSAPQ